MNLIKSIHVKTLEEAKRAAITASVFENERVICEETPFGEYDISIKDAIHFPSRVGEHVRWYERGKQVSHFKYDQHLHAVTLERD